MGGVDQQGAKIQSRGYIAKAHCWRWRRRKGFDPNGLLSVEDQIRRLKHPVRVGILSDISGLSEATLRKKIEQGKLRAFKRSGIILIEPKDFLKYWAGGTNGATYNPLLFARRPLNVD